MNPKQKIQFYRRENSRGNTETVKIGRHRTLFLLRQQLKWEAPREMKDRPAMERGVNGTKKIELR